MACKWSIARPGYKWTLTDRGKELGRIRAKFADDYTNRLVFIKKVPEAWVTNHYVVEVVDGQK